MSKAQTLPFTHYTADSEINPLPSAEVYGIHQDRLGNMWFAVYSSGIVRYDGHQIDLFTTANGLRDLAVRSITEDTAGYLWIGSDGGVSVSTKPLQQYDLNESIAFRTTIGPDALADVATGQKALVSDSAGSVWVGTVGHGIYQYRLTNGGLVKSHSDATLPDGTNGIVESILVRSNGSVWATVEGPEFADILVFEEKPIASRLSQSVDNLPDTFSSLAEDDGGNIWIGTNDGRLLRIQSTRTKRAEEIESGFPLEVQRIVSSGRYLYAAVSGSGLVRVSLEPEISLQTFGGDSGLLSESIHDAFVDREGNLWLSQSGGVSKLRSNYSAFRNYPAASLGGQDEISSPAVPSVVARRGTFGGTCDLFAATAAGVSCVSDDGATLFQADLQRSNALVFDSRGRLWVGTDTGIRGLSPSPSLRFP